MTEKSIKLLVEALAGPIAAHVQATTQPLLDRIRKLEDRANDLENELNRKQR